MNCLSLGFLEFAAAWRLDVKIEGGCVRSSRQRPHEPHVSFALLVRPAVPILQPNGALAERLRSEQHAQGREVTAEVGSGATRYWRQGPLGTLQVLFANPVELLQARSRNDPSGQPFEVEPLHCTPSVLRKQSTVCVKSVPGTQLLPDQTCGVQRCVFLPISSQSKLYVQTLVSTQTVAGHPEGTQMPPEQGPLPQALPQDPQLAGSDSRFVV